MPVSLASIRLGVKYVTSWKEPILDKGGMYQWPWVLSSNFSLKSTRDENRIHHLLAKYSDISELVSNGRFEEVPWIHPDVCVTLKDGKRFAFECDGPVHFYWDLKKGKELHLGKDLVSASVLKGIGIHVVRLDFRDFSLGDDNDLEHFVAYSLNLPYRAAA